MRDECGPDFSLGVRLSPERFGLKLGRDLDRRAKADARGQIDYLDMSLWDVFKQPEEEAFKGKLLLDCFTELERGSVKLGAAGRSAVPSKRLRRWNAGSISS